MATKKVETKTAETVKDTAIVEVKKEVPAVKREAEKAVPAVKKETAKKETAKKPAVKKAEAKPEVKAEAKPEVKAEVKPEVKAEAKPEVKAEVKAEVKPAAKAETKPEVKAAVKAPSKKAPAKKAPVKKAEPKASVVVEYSGKQIVAKDILDQAKKAFAKANKGVEIKTIEVYVKPEENVAYYVVNGVGSDEFRVQL